MGTVKLLDFEKKIIGADQNLYDGESQMSIDEKYNKGVSRVVTETGSYKVSLLKDIFVSGNYILEPDYQRRITWDKKKRSKLIESLIMNIPVPPIYLYEKDYNQYEIMDGLQRVTAIIDFYNDEYALVGLEEWKDLNGKRYSSLPKIIAEGIDRRQLSVITLLKETALDSAQAEKIKRVVFERLNTGGVKLTGQEIRNALFGGRGNDMCKELSENGLFRKLWEMPEKDLENEASSDVSVEEMFDDDELYSPKQLKKLKNHSLYKRMGDVEIVLRFFAMRHIDAFCYGLSSFLDDGLKLLNSYNQEQLFALKELFLRTLRKADLLFGNYAFKCFKDGEWTSPIKMVYDPLMIALSNIDLDLEKVEENVLEERVGFLKDFYEIHAPSFAGKLQTQGDIKDRISVFSEFLSRYESK